MKMPVKFRRSSLLTKFVIGLLLVSCTVILVSQRTLIRENQEKKAELTNQAAQLQQENQELEADIAGLGTDESVKEIAREKLGLIGSGEVIFSDIGD